MGSSSISALISTLVPVLLIYGIIFVLFLVCQKKHERVYGPRTFLPSLRSWEYSPKRSPGLFGWTKELNSLQDEYVLGHSSIDNYLWIRFFKVLATICFVGCCITWPILFPINATGGNGASQFNIVAFSNSKPGVLYYAQALVAWVVLGFIMFMITRESRFYLRVRQLLALTPYEHSKLSTRTVLFTNVPEASRSEEWFRGAFHGVNRAWLVNVPVDLAKNVKQRDKAALKLDASENKLLKKHTKRQLKQAKKDEKARKKGKTAPTPTPEQLESTGGQVAVHPKDIPRHRLPILGFLPLGKKVETIDWSRGELRRLIPQVDQEQLAHRGDKSMPQGAVFVEFATMHDANNAIQLLRSEKKNKMVPAQLGVAPDEVIWDSIVKKPSKLKITKILSTAFVWWLCIFWAIPVALVGIISNVNYLEKKVPFLSWIADIPKVILGVVTGLLPVVLLIVLMALVPIVMGILAGKFEPTRAAQQLRVQSWYFPFQVIQVFLVVTLASAATGTAAQIVSDPSSATTLLAKKLPTASNFYLSYFVLIGIKSFVMGMFNLVPLLFFTILGNLLDGTPRKKFNRYTSLASIGWGSSYPVYTNLGVIAIVYAMIAPLVMGFACIGFFLLYIAYRYNVFFVLGNGFSTRGAAYGRAIKQLTVGLYLSELCLIGLMAIGTAKTTEATGPLVLMIIFLVATILWHIWLNRSLRKAGNTLPDADVAEKNAGYDNALTSGHGNGNSNGADVPMHPGYTNGSDGYTNGYNGYAAHDNEKSYGLPATSIGPAPQERLKPGFMERIKLFFKPESDAARVMRILSPHLGQRVPTLSPQEHDEAFIPPAVTSPCPIIWLARDKYGLSTQEVAGSSEQISAGERFIITQEHAWFNDKGKIEWDTDNVRAAPLWEEETIY